MKAEAPDNRGRRSPLRHDHDGHITATGGGAERERPFPQTNTRMTGLRSVIAIPNDEQLKAYTAQVVGNQPEAK